MYEVDSFTEAFFGVNPEKLQAVGSKEYLLEEMRTLQLRMAELLTQLRNGTTNNKYLITPEMIQGHREVFPFFTGDLTPKKRTSDVVPTTFGVTNTQVPMEYLCANQFDSAPNMARTYITLPIYHYNIEVDSAAGSLYLVTDHSWLPQLSDPCWKRASSSSGGYHPHEGDGQQRSQSLCFGTNPAKTMIQRKQVKDSASFNLWLINLLTWVKTVNLDDNYGGYATPAITPNDLEMHRVGSYIRDHNPLKPLNQLLRKGIPYLGVNSNRRTQQLDKWILALTDQDLSFIQEDLRSLGEGIFNLRAPLLQELELDDSPAYLPLQRVICTAISKACTQLRSIQEERGHCSADQAHRLYTVLQATYHMVYAALYYLLVRRDPSSLSSGNKLRYQVLQAIYEDIWVLCVYGSEIANPLYYGNMESYLDVPKSAACVLQDYLSADHLACLEI